MEESHYAKAKTHIVKVQYTTRFDGLIVHKTAHSPGRWHDFKIYKIKHPTFPDGLSCGDETNSEKFRRDRLRHYVDAAYIAMSKAVPELDYVMPFKRRPGRDLTPEQRKYNKATLGSAYAWSGIRKMKIFRIMKKYGNKLKKYDHINDIVYGWSTKPSC